MRVYPILPKYNLKHADCNIRQTGALRNSPCFKGENTIITLPSGITYEIDEKSIEDLPQDVKGAFYLAVKEVEAAMAKNKNEGMEDFHFIFKCEEKRSASFPYNLEMYVQHKN